jgi:CubicO group peptidase (beta-lactamase class C family)
VHAPDDLARTLDLHAVERLVTDLHGAGEPPGMAYGVVLDGELVHSGGRGVRVRRGDRPDAGTVFRIASMTKSFTASAVLLLRDDGALRLDDEVARYVPEAAGLRPPGEDTPELTLRSLLTMSGGFPTDDPWGDRQQDLPDDEFARLLAEGLSFAWTPGSAFEYSNLGYALLGRVISAAAGRPYRDVVTERLLAPLGMRSTVFEAHEVPAADLAHGYRPAPSGRGWEPVPFAGYGAFAPMGGLFSTVRDLARWVGGLTGAYLPPDRETCDHPLSRASRRELQQPHHGLPATVTWSSLAEPPRVRSVGYGFGLVIEQDPALGRLVNHSGGYPGFGSHMRWHLGSGLGVVLLGNATYTPMARLGTRLMDLLLCGRPHGPRAGAVVRGPAGGSMAAASASAREQVNRLISAWDDDLAARLLASNVDDDLPLAERRTAIADTAARLGPLEPDDRAGIDTLSPAHCAWWLRGPGGRVRVEIRLSPQLPPLVQTLTVVAVPTPPDLLRRAAAWIADALGRPEPGWPGPLAVGALLDAGHVDRQLRVAAAWAGRCTVDDVLVSDGHREATFRLLGERTRLQLTLVCDPTAEVLTAVTLVPAPADPLPPSLR